MLVDKVNAAGGINGEQIALTLYDDGGDPNKARTFATRLVEDDEVVAIIGGTTTGTTMSIIPAAEDAEIPFISLAGAIEIIDPVKEWVFKTPHTDRMACQKIFEDMKARGITKIGMISGTDGFGASMRKQCLEVVGEYGIEIVADESYGPTDADMTPQLTNIKNTAGIAGGAQSRASARARRSSPATTSSSPSACRSTRATASPRRASSTSPGPRPPRASACPAPRSSSATSSPTTTPQKPVVAAYVDGVHRRLRRGALDLRRLRPRRLRHPRRRPDARRLGRAARRSATRSKGPRASPAPPASSP